LIGLPFFNILDYFQISLDFGFELCGWKYVKEYDILKIFDIPDKMNGVYIMIFLCTQKEFISVIGKGFKRAFKNTALTKTRKTDNVNDTEL
jgi:hypothetical protein